MGGAYESVLNVSANGGGEQYRLLRYETDLGSEPLHIQFTNVHAVQTHRASEGVIKPLDQRDNGRFPRSRSTYECCGLACRERKAKFLKNLNVCARGVIEVNIFKSNFASDCARLEALLAGGINARDQLDSGIDLCCCRATIGNSYLRQQRSQSFSCLEKQTCSYPATQGP
jgi:hypothetical protein